MLIKHGNNADVEKHGNNPYVEKHGNNADVYNANVAKSCECSLLNPIYKVEHLKKHYERCYSEGEIHRFLLT